MVALAQWIGGLVAAVDHPGHERSREVPFELAVEPIGSRVNAIGYWLRVSPDCKRPISINF